MNTNDLLNEIKDLLTVGYGITAITSGVQITTVAGVPKRLAAISIDAKWTLVQAIPANTTRLAAGDINIDETPASVRGIILYAGESQWFPLDPYDIYIDVATTAQGATYIALK